MFDEYEKYGFFCLRNFLGKRELQELTAIVTSFHRSWIQENAQLYAERAVNSAYLTGTKHLTDGERELLFKFIGSAKLRDQATSVMGAFPAFLNTQLFFDPVNKTQKNYWHRDPQYHLTLEEQQQALQGPNVVHFRIPLVDEPGMELVPGTHKRWDSDQELDVRLERNGCRNWDDLSSGVSIKLNAGDLLIFSANMIHRGLYGMDRLALDILLCDPTSEPMKFVDDFCLPDPEMLKKLECPEVFERTIANRANHLNSK